jgi:hypothetical protein
MSEQVFIKLDMYIMAFEPISLAHFINPAYQSVSLRIVAWQRLGRHVPVATNTHNRILVGGVFYTVWVV